MYLCSGSLKSCIILYSEVLFDVLVRHSYIPLDPPLDYEITITCIMYRTASYQKHHIDQNDSIHHIDQSDSMWKALSLLVMTVWFVIEWISSLLTIVV